MTAYLVMQITITDPKRWSDYREGGHAPYRQVRRPPCIRSRRCRHARAVAGGAEADLGDDRSVVALDGGLGGEVGRVPVGDRLYPVSGSRAVLGGEVTQAGLQAAQAVRGALIAQCDSAWKKPFARRLTDRMAKAPRFLGFNAKGN